MAKPYNKLRHALDDADITRADIAREIGRHQTYVDQRFRCEFPWTVEDAYIILAMLQLPAGLMTEYFPNEKIKGRRAAS